MKTPAEVSSFWATLTQTRDEFYVDTMLDIMAEDGGIILTLQPDELFFLFKLYRT